MLVISSPTVEEWLRKIAYYRTQLLNPTPQMTVLLSAVRQDIDKQFDENQSKWTPLAPYTVSKKLALKADPRILHESKSNRLRDAYASAGVIDGSGKITYSYPESKPYAREHQEGVTKEDSKTKKKLSRTLAKEMRRLDKEYRDLFDRNR